MTPIERITLYGIKHIIERENWTPEIRKQMDEDICNKIVEIVAPKKDKEDCCEMGEKIGCGKYFVDKVIPELEKLEKWGRVRIVFWFDN